MPVFTQFFIYKVFYATLENIAMKNSVGNVINNRLNYKLRANRLLTLLRY